MNQKGGMWVGIFILIVGFGIAGIYVITMEPIVQAFATGIGIDANAQVIISGFALLIIICTLFFAFTQNTNLPWWAGGAR